MKGLRILYKKMKQQFQKIIFQNIQTEFLKNYLLAKNAYSSIINSRIIIRMLDERVLHPQEENEVIFKKSPIFQTAFQKIAYLIKDITGVVWCIYIYLFVYPLEQQSGSLLALLPLSCTMHLQRVTSMLVLIVIIGSLF